MKKWGVCSMLVKQGEALLGFQCRCGYDSTVDYIQAPTLALITEEDLAREYSSAELSKFKKELLNANKKIGELYAALDAEKYLKENVLSINRQLQQENLNRIHELNNLKQELIQLKEKQARDSKIQLLADTRISNLRKALNQAQTHIRDLEASARK